MSDCQLVTHYETRNSHFWSRTHDEDCLVNENNEYWHKFGFKKRVYADFVKKYKGKGIPSIDKGHCDKFAKEVFEITLDLILKDLIEKNQNFYLPCNITGYFRMANIGRKKYDLRLGFDWNRLIVVDFKKNSPWHPYMWIVTLGNPYKKLMIGLKEKGHFYTKYRIKNV